MGTLDVDRSGTLDFEELIAGISKMRGDARRSDVVGVILIVRAIQAQLDRLKVSMGIERNTRRYLQSQQDEKPSQLQQEAERAYCRQQAFAHLKGASRMLETPMKLRP